MKIIILGAGQVGGTLAENLVGENNDITIVDTNGDRLRVLQDKFDLRVVQGHGSHPRVLREAGADDADMLVAVTSSDETNMVACQVAYSLFNTPNRIARIRSPDYVRDAEKLFNSEAVPIDHLIAPEQLVIDNIYRLIEYPGALQVVNFAEGKVSLAVVKAYYGGPLIGNALSTMREHMPHIDTRVAAIFRHDRPIRPQGSTIVEAGDEVFFIASSQHIRAVMSELQRLEKPYKRIMLVGGGNITVSRFRTGRPDTDCHNGTAIISETKSLLHHPTEFSRINNQCVRRSHHHISIRMFFLYLPTGKSNTRGRIPRTRFRQNITFRNFRQLFPNNIYIFF